MLVIVSALGMLNPAQTNASVISTSTTSEAVGDIAFLYYDDTDGATIYQEFLEEHGFTVDLIQLDSVALYDYSAYKLVIIGSKTGYNYNWFADANIVYNSKTPILGLGAGGANFYQDIGRSINWGHSWVSFTTELFVMRPCHPVFTTPYSIPIPDDGIIPIAESSRNVAVYSPRIDPSVMLLGQEVPGSDHYTLVMEQQEKLMLWGYDADPSQMTTVGKQLFINVVAYMSNIPSTPTLSGKIAYIYNTDTTTQANYAELLMSWGYEVAAIPLSRAAATDFGIYDLIIIGPDTQADKNYYEWADDAVAVNKLGTPVLGLGRGGASFFQEIGQSINWGNCWISHQHQMYIPSGSCQPIFNMPNRIPIPSDQTVTVYKEGTTSSTGHYEPVLNPGVVLYGREPSSETHFTLVQEGNNMIWGYDAGPAYMSTVGKQLFINVVAHMMELKKPVTLAGNIAYIYSESSVISTGYETLLEDHGYTVDMLQISGLARYDLSKYCLIIIGSKTGYGYEWDGDASQVIDAGTPVLGLGTGGTNFFQAWPSMTMNWGNSWLKWENQMYIPRRLSEGIFLEPYSINIPEDRVITVYTQTNSLGLYDPVLSTNVDLLGRETDNVNHWTLAREPDETGLEHILWGYDEGPSLMTSTGKQLFINVVDSLCLTPPPITKIPPITLIPIKTILPQITKLPPLTLQPTCRVTIDRVYGIQSAGGSYAEVVVAGQASGSNKVEVTINCAGNSQTQSIEVDAAGFWQVVFDGTISECICDETPLTVTVRSLDPLDANCVASLELPELPCEIIQEECAVYIRDVYGETDPTGGLTITITGTATNCKVVEVTIVCGARLITKAIVNADGTWKAILEGRLAECECDQPIEVIARCIDPPLQDCIARLSLNALPCITPEEDCLVGIDKVYGILNPEGRVDTVVVRGFAENCWIVEVSLNCQGQEQRERVQVDRSGRWEVVLDGRLSECECGQPVTVKVVCIDPPVKDCSAELTIRELPCVDPEDECSIFIRDVHGEPLPTGELNVVVSGTAIGCNVIEVIIRCQGPEYRTKVEVNADGYWEIKFNGLPAECFCDGPIYVQAYCIDPAIKDCADFLELKELPCPPSLEAPCKIEITDVFSLSNVIGTPLVEKVYVQGVARGCDILAVSIQCQAHVHEMKARVDPVTGRWEAVFDGIEAECECDKPIEIRVWCIVPDLPNCVAYLKLDAIPCIPGDDCTIHIEGVFLSRGVYWSAAKASQTDVSENIERVNVWGTASGFDVVHVTLTCGAKTSANADVQEDGTWQVVLDGTAAQCFQDRPAIIEACGIDPTGNEVCCDYLELERLPTPEIPPEQECFIEIIDVFGEPLATTAGVRVHVRGLAYGCRLVEVVVNCQGQEVRTRADVDPSSGRWEAILDGLLAECECDQPISVKVRCLVPELADCVAVKELDALPCPPVDECQIWIQGVYLEEDPEDPSRLGRFIVTGTSRGCDTVQVFIKFGDQTLTEMGTVESDGYWKVVFDVRNIQYPCNELVVIEACCISASGEILCCDVLEMRWPCPDIPPVTTVPVDCDVTIVEVIPEKGFDDAGNEIIDKVIVKGKAIGCRKVEVHLTCQQELVMTVEVDPTNGEWEAVFDGRKAVCNCDVRIEVRAYCVDPPRDDCGDIFVMDNPCLTEPIQPTTTRDSETSDGGPSPGFGLFEALFAILTLLGLAQLRRVRR